MEEDQSAGEYVCPTTEWEKRLQTQEEEVMLLKSVLRDVLQRLQNLEIHSHPGNSCNSSFSVVQSVKDAITPSNTCSEPKKNVQEMTSLRITVGTQTEMPLVEGESKESLDTLDGNLLCENHSVNGETADVITDFEEAQVVDKVFESPPPEEGGPCTKSVSALRQNKKELLRRNSSSDKLVREARDKSKKLEKKSVSSANLINASAGSRRGNYNLEGVSVKVFLRGRPITMYIPSNIQNHDDQKPELPSEKLQLEWVYGCRGRDSRCTLRMLKSGEVLYFTACVIVMCDVHRGTQRHFLRHTDCVRCLAVHPDGVRVASGQTAGVDKDGKPLVFIWDSSTLQILHQIGLGFFERGVGCLAFSIQDSGSYLCVVDDCNEHILSIWDTAKGNKIAETKCTNEPVLCVAFNPVDSNYIVTVGKSHIHFWTWSGTSLTKKQGIFGKYKKPRYVQCLLFDRTDVLTGDSEGQILTWGRSAADTRTLGKGAKDTYQILRHTRAHDGSVSSLTALRGGFVLSSGGKDKRLVLWSDTLTQLKECEISEQFGAVRSIAEGVNGELLVGTTKNALLKGSLEHGFTPVIQGHTDELWGLATHPTQNIFMTTGHDKQLCIWNGSSHTLSWACILEDTGLCADFHPNGREACVGLSTGKWLVLDMHSHSVMSVHSDGNEQFSVVRYSPDGSYLAIGSHDNVIYIYSTGNKDRKGDYSRDSSLEEKDSSQEEGESLKGDGDNSVSDRVQRYMRYGKCMGHSSFITHLDWSKDGKYIMSNSGDYEILYWDIAGGCKLLRNRFESRDREWATYTCVLGYHVFGVWPEGSDGTDINALARSRDMTMISVADDFCKVHLFRYPCNKPKAPSHVYSGHGSHVTNVRFNHDDTCLISLGGKDASIFQWRVVRGANLSRSQSLSSASSLEIAS
ncbi:PREDICTED: echinoderm microtubule-associated protein-like 3 [Nanorana parkeri]|uniref:echinoderm microtubule-associated protein-like 3 n=1 Tax=Nanorana parkeri TaxID=125878 RepID=UPI0008550B19|nr:PREDICTED: echinoderm microtubule-associated protein-like 3 [Nanorana parkeri]